MDQTQKPLLIPPEFALYADKHEIFELYQRILSQLLINTPEEPIQFLIDFVSKDLNSHEIIVLGPPSSGKKTICRYLAKKLNLILINKTNLLENVPVSLKTEFASLKKEAFKSEHWIKLLKARVDDFECKRKGWILEGFPETREQALVMLSAGIIPKHTIFLEAKDTVLIERSAGKRIDPKTGDIYHTTFDVPIDHVVKDRLGIPPNYTEADVMQRLIAYNRYVNALKDCLGHNSKVLNVDQPKGDVLNQVMQFVSKPARSVAPVTPRVLLVGPVGAGKKTQAQKFAKKYNIVNVEMSHLIKQAIASESLLGNACKPYVQKKIPIPESLIMQLIRERLGQLDCVSRGWILHGFPRSRDQAESLERAGYAPNKVFFMNLPLDSIIERMTLKSVDSVTGHNYHLLFNPPTSKEVTERLRQNPKDLEQAVRAKVGEYQSYCKELAEHYENVSLNVNADQDLNTVFEIIESGIINKRSNMQQQMN